MKRKTKIIATIGPASLKYEIFKKIIEEGANFIRINTAYSNSKQHSRINENLKKTKGYEKIQLIFDVRNPGKIKDIYQYNPSIIALSFTESISQLKEIKKNLPSCKIISKIESKKGVKNFDEILDYSYGVMVARGDLGRAVSLEKVPCLQKEFSKKTLNKKKFLIIATEMLLSMIKNKKPTRAEVSDVANSVFDGACSVMLSEETAIGKNPVESIKYMRKIIEEAEKCV